MLDITSAHITTFGEKAVDVFYVTDLVGKKVTNEGRQQAIQEALERILEGAEGEMRAALPDITAG
jgi:[protein-PII] uridylyltransferase